MTTTNAGGAAAGATAAVRLPAIIDVATDVGLLAPKLKAAGVETVIRYYAHRSRTPEKLLDAAEVGRLRAAGLNVAAVFEQTGGYTGDVSDLDAAHGARDGKRAFEMAGQVMQPAGTGIYFAVDYDFHTPKDLATIRAYFAAARAALDGRYRIGAYGSGVVLAALLDAHLIDLVWLAGATGWGGTKAFRDAQPRLWHLFQNGLEKKSPFGFSYDGNIAAVPDFGQFWPPEGGEAAPVTPAPPPMRTLRLGDRGEDVKVAQRLLGVADDGIYGPKTKAAAIAVQRAHGLAQDGVFGPKTRAALIPDVS